MTCVCLGLHTHTRLFVYEYAKIFITANNYGDLNNNLIKLFMCEARKLWLGKINGLWWSTAIPNSWLLIWETVQIRSSHIITLRDSIVNYYGSSGKWLPAYPNVAQGILAVIMIVFVKQKNRQNEHKQQLPLRKIQI